MADSQIINIDEIGPVLFEKSERAKRINISIRPPNAIRVAVPRRTSIRKALEFCHLQREWIQRQLKKIEQDKKSIKPLQEAYSAYDTVAAKRKLKDRLSYLAGEYGFTFNRVSVRNQATRWGSCSSTNNISLNMKLIVLPDELVDYVLFHELVHTRIHNHSREFWSELDRYTGNAKAMAKQLKAYNLRLLE